MRIVSISNQVLETGFAKRAAEAMLENPRLYTFADGDPAPGQPLAIRWNSFTVLVVMLDQSHEPACYPTHDLIGTDLPKLLVDYL